MDRRRFCLCLLLLWRGFGCACAREARFRVSPMRGALAPADPTSANHPTEARRRSLAIHRRARVTLELALRS
jgi:hypothetical protein